MPPPRASHTLASSPTHTPPPPVQSAPGRVRAQCRTQRGAVAVHPCLTLTRSSRVPHAKVLQHLILTLPCKTELALHEAEAASWSVLHAELTCQTVHTPHLEAAHARNGRAERPARTPCQGTSRGEPHPRALRGLCRRAARDCCGTCPLPSFSYFCCQEPHGYFRARDVVLETPVTTPVSITQSRPLRLEHPHLLEEDGAGHVVLHQCEAGLIDA